MKAFLVYLLSYVIWSVWRLGNNPLGGYKGIVFEYAVVMPLVWIGPAVPLLLKKHAESQWLIPPREMMRGRFPWLPALTGLCLSAMFLHTVHIFGVGIRTWGIFEASQILLSLSAAVVEEIVFRGVLFNQQAVKLGIYRAAALNGILFAIYHFPRLLIGQEWLALIGFRFWLIVMTGSIFSVVFAKWRHLGVTMVIHFGWNMMSYLFATA